MFALSLSRDFHFDLFSVSLRIGPFLFADVLDLRALRELVVNYEIDWLIHFSALLSAIGEQNVPLAMQVNIEGVHNVLEVSRNFGLKLFIPSTIGEYAGKGVPFVLDWVDAVL